MSRNTLPEDERYGKSNSIVVGDEPECVLRW